MDKLTEFDRPLFKRLAHNDTGAAVGHQGGVLIPKDLDRYFPDLSKKVSAASAAADEDIRAALFIGNVPKGMVSTRYQYQTWGKTRPPERRITGNLTALRNVAHAGDILVIERSVSDQKLYRMRLIRAGDAAYKELQAQTAGRNWGPLDPNDRPVTEKAVLDAVADQATHEHAPLELFDNSAAFTETWTKSVARSRAFQSGVTQLYDFKCAACGKSLRSPAGSFEIEAAHIVPRGLKGADDARNGLALCRSHHWAFDRGLFGVNPSKKITIPKKVADLAENSELVKLDSKPLLPPSKAALGPAPQALAWHMTNIVSQHL